MPGNKQLGIEAKHVDMIKYGINAINNMPKKERVLADMLREKMYRAWDLIGQQQWSHDRLRILYELDNQIGGLKRLVRLANDLGLLRGRPDEDGKSKPYYIWSAMLVEEGKIIGAMINTTKKAVKG